MRASNGSAPVSRSTRARMIRQASSPAKISALRRPASPPPSTMPSAQTATLGYAGGALGAGNSVTLEVSGNAGTQQVSVAGGATVANIISAINGVKAATGVSASVSGANLRVDSQVYGSKQFVTLKT